MRPHVYPPAALVERKRESGVSLVELLVALTIGSLLIVGAVSVLMQSRTTYRTNETAARLQEVARYALDTIEPDVRLAGFWGLTDRADFVDNRGLPTEPKQAVDPAANNCGQNFTVNTMSAVEGRDSASTGGTGYDLAACPATTPAPWADVLIVRRASSDVAALQSGRMQIQSNRMRAVIFHDGVLPPLFDAAASQTRNMIVHAYYVSRTPATATRPTQYRLMRRTLTAAAPGNTPTMDDVEIVPGVEDLQVQFGIDAAPRDGNVDRYVNPNAVPAGARIASVRIWLRVIAEDREIGFTNNTNWVYGNANYGVLNDDRRRVLVTKTIQIRNSPI